MKRCQDCVWVLLYHPFPESLTCTHPVFEQEDGCWRGVKDEDAADCRWYGKREEDND